MNRRKIIPSHADTFFLHLKEHNSYRQDTARYMNNIANEYVQWLQANNINMNNMVYKDLLDYIGYLQAENKNKTNINYRLRTISYYNNYLQVNDVAKDVRMRGVAQKQNLFLTEEELNQLYQHFESINTKGHYLHSDKLILSLLIYQGLEENDILKIELKDLKLAEGKIYVPAGSHTKNSRILTLEAHQILAFKEFIDQYRKPYHKQHELTEKLFSPNADKEHRLHDQFKILSKSIKKVAEKLNIHLPKLHLLRQSRIALWNKQYGLRQTQYLGGFKAIKSAEHYRTYDITDLAEQIKLFHPLNEA
jgi:integrase/recombinase XerD